MPWAPSKPAAAWPGGNTSPPLPGKGLKTTAALWVLGGTGGQRGWTQGPKGGCRPRLFTLPWLVQRGWFRVHPSLYPSSGPGPTTTQQGLEWMAALGLCCHGEPGSPACLSSTKRPWRCQCPPPPPTRDGSVCRAGRCFLPDGWGPRAAVIRALRGASVSTGLHHPSLLRHK